MADSDPLFSEKLSAQQERSFLKKAGDWIRSRLLLCFAAIALAGTVEFAPGVIAAVDNTLSALRMRTIQSSPSETLLVVRIDTRSLRAAGVWPWPRERYATAIDNLRKAGAELIAFDVDFSAASNRWDDEVLKEAIEAQPGSVVMPTFVQRDGDFVNSPLAEISNDAIFGGVNVELDRDGKVRRYRRGYVVNDRYQQSMGALLAGAPHGDTSSFQLDYGVRLSEIDRISFEDIYRGNFNPDIVRGRHVLIGATALELGDTFSTPNSPAMPGVFVHALGYENLLSGRTLLELSPHVVLGIGLLALVLLWPRRGRINMGRLAATQGLVIAAVVLIPFLVQALAPVSLDIGVIMLAQILSIWAAVHQELDRRSAEIIQQREEHLAFIALHDAETGLPNRRAMLDRLDHILAAHPHEEVHVVVLGIERFATLRGAIGYAQTTEVVRRFAAYLEKEIAQGEVFYLSTSVFGMVFAADADARVAQWVRDGLRDLDTHFDDANYNIDLTLRSGTACADFDGVNGELLLERASVALDEARQSGRMHVQFSDIENPDQRVQLALVSDVARGLELGEFSLVYQPKWAARNDAIAGAEALIRWEHLELGPIRPDRFIPVAEETGAIGRLTRWTLDKAIADQAYLRSRGVRMTISVNVSARLLSDQKFCESAIRKIQNARADICLEITETAVIDNPRQAMKSIAAFKRAGVKISIDDYGAGLSSLMYLKQISANELKLDRALFDEIRTSFRDQTIVRSTVALAHSLGMTVVAEGIEDEATRQMVTELGCDMIQGYCLARPMPIAELAALVTPELTAPRLRAASGA